MASFNRAIITNKGRALIAKSLINTDIKFTKIRTSEKDYGTVRDLENIISIENVKQTELVSEANVLNNSTVQVIAPFTNTLLTTGYYLRTIGLYANDPDEGEILYSITTAIMYDWIPPFSSTSVTSFEVKLSTVISNSNNLDLTINPEAVVNISQFNKFKEQVVSQLSDIQNQTYITEKAKQTDLLVTDAKANNPLSQISDLSIPSAKLKILNDSDRLGLANLKQEVIQAMAGTTSVNSIPADKSVTPIRTSFFVTGKNLFDKDVALIGKYVSESNGTIGTNSSYITSDYIPVSPNNQYARTGNSKVAFYDSNKTFISGLSSGTITTPSNCAYMICSFVNLSIDEIQIEKGNVVTSYEPYNNYIPKELLEIKGIDKTQTNFVALGKNLFDKNSAIIDSYIGELNGTMGTNTNYYASDYISITPNTQYYAISGLHSAFYDINKIFISGSASLTMPFTSPANAYYFRTSVPKSLIDTMQIEKGNIATSYEPYGIKLINSLLEKQVLIEEFKLFLPSEICVAVGRTIELYNNQVSWCGNINNYHFKWDCTIGKTMKRKFTVTGTTALIGEYALALTAYDNNMNVVASASTIIKIISATISNAKNLLTIGDSLTNNKAWLGELRTLSSNKFTMVGTRGTTPLKHEGRSGWSTGGYLTGQSYTYENEGVNPFWDGTRFNWNYYKTNSLVTPDAIQIFLGTNGMSLDATTNASKIKQMVDYIRQDDANIPIFLVFTLYRGNQDGIGDEISSDGYAGSNKGVWKLEEDRKVFNLMIKLYSLLSSYNNLHFVPISLCHDSEFNFGAVSTPVNPRAVQTELLPVQATHPQDQGYFQFADIMFSVMAKYLNS